MVGCGADSSWIFNADSCAPRDHAVHARLPKDGEEEAMSRLLESAIDQVGDTRFSRQAAFHSKAWWRTGKLVRLTSTECS